MQPIIDALTLHRTGYTFSGWQNYPKNGKMPPNDLYLTAKWNARNDTPYTVEHYRESVEQTGSYVLYKTIPLS